MVNRVRGLLQRKLQRKLVRDLMAQKGLFLAVTAVIFLGVAFFGASFLGYRNLKNSYDYTYETLNFADFTVKVMEAPPEVSGTLGAVPGVESVTARVNVDLALTLPGEDEKRVHARVISLPAASRPEVNNVKVEEGSYLSAGQVFSILVENSFAEHHGLHPGDDLFLSWEDQQASFTIAGIVTSPEYIWPARSRQEILVSPETFGVVFIPEDIVAGLVGQPVVNEFCVTVEDGADRQAVIDAAADVLEPWGVLEVVTSEEQPSNAALSLDLQEFGEMAEVFPLLFLIVGGLAMYILLNRMVHNQRPQIGLMRAMGYSRRQVLGHYLSFALIIGVIGAAAGMLAGYLLSAAITSLYVDMLGLPYTVTRMGWVEWLAIEEGLLLGIVPCAVAGVIPALAASRLSPAEAMRTAPPAAGRKLLLERLLPFLGRLSYLWKIPLRNIFRSRRRSLYTIIGIAFGISLILVSAAFIDSIDHLVHLQFNDIQRYDAQISFVQPVASSVTEEVSGWDETELVEPALELPATLEHGEATYTTMAVGLPPESELYRLYETGGKRVKVADGVVWLSEGLRSTLDVETGDRLVLRSPVATGELEVVGFVQQPMGSYAYVTLGQAQELIEMPDVVTSLMVDAGPGQADSIRQQAYQIPGAASVELTAESLAKVNDLMGLLRVMMYVMLAFGAALALAIVFTTVTISILERRREIATMRTLGEGKRRITAMLTIENLTLGLVGIIPGIPLGLGLALLLFNLIQTDMMSFSLVVFPRTYVMTVGLVIVIMLISQWPGLRNVHRLDLARVIKEQAG